MDVLVASLNPVKVKAVRQAFQIYFSGCAVQGVAIPSGVADQPVGDDVFAGAENRCQALEKYACDNGLVADFFAGIESGLIKLHGIWFNVDCVCLKDNKGKTGCGLSPAYCLNEEITTRLLQGEELGNVIDDIYGTSNIKQNGGAISVISRGIISRTEHCYQGVLMALVPFL